VGRAGFLEKSILNKFFISVIAVFCLLACVAGTYVKTGCSTMKTGFTTQNFLPAVPVSVKSAKQFVLYAKDEGFSWIELRDPDASLTPEQCREIAAFAERNGIEIVYSAQRGLLADDFDDVFDRALSNTILFSGPNVVRVLALRGEGAFGWSADELRRMVQVADQAGKAAAARGYRLMIENADAVLDGNGKGCFGMIQLLDAVSPDVELQLDTANLFTGPEAVSPEAAVEFIRRYAPRISYVHLKSARHRKPQPVLCGNPLEFETVWSLLSADGSPPYVAVELASGDASINRIYMNMKASREWLENERKEQR
jgi:sugar phosphate isomerase/epimerase